MQVCLSDARLQKDRREDVAVVVPVSLCHFHCLVVPSSACLLLSFGSFFVGVTSKARSYLCNVVLQTDL